MLVLSLFSAIVSVSVLALQSKACNASIKDQTFICSPGKAIASILWEEETEKIKKFTTECIIVTDQCEEVCQWTAACTIKNSGTDIYVRGFRAMFDNPRDIRRFIFLCCDLAMVNKRDRITDSRSCGGSTAELRPTSINPTYKSYIRQARSNFPEISPVRLYVEACAQNCIVSTRLCPADKMHSRIGTDPALADVPGLAGLVGLAGLALIRRKPTSSQSPSPSPSPSPLPSSTKGPCCAAPNCCSGCCCNAGTALEMCDQLCLQCDNNQVTPSEDGCAVRHC